jgi:two-component system sensor histidine kinase AgrC
MEYEIEQQKFYNSTLDSSLENLRRIKHDINNHLGIIQSMLERDDKEEAVLYLQEICETNNTIGNTSLLNIKNAGLFGIISTKRNMAEKLNVNFKLLAIGLVESIPNIKISELCEVIGIYHDNAIEAAKESGEKTVEVIITSTEQSYL